MQSGTKLNCRTIIKTNVVIKGGTKPFWPRRSRLVLKVNESNHFQRGAAWAKTHSSLWSSLFFSLFKCAFPCLFFYDFICLRRSLRSFLSLRFFSFFSLCFLSLKAVLVEFCIAASLSSDHCRSSPPSSPAHRTHSVERKKKKATSSRPLSSIARHPGLVSRSTVVTLSLPLPIPPCSLQICPSHVPTLLPCK